MPKDGRSIAEIEGDIRAARERLGRTVDALERKAAPAQLVMRGLDMIDKSSGDRPLSRRVLEALARNPVPVALVGAGIGWLLWSSLRGETKNERAARRLGEIADAEQPSEPEFAPAAPDFIDDEFDEPIDPTDAEDGIAAAPAKPSTANMLARHPLALGGLAAVVGAVVAAFLPATRSEDELLGPAGDTLRDRVGDTAEDVLSRIETIARDAAAAAVGAAFDTVREEFVPPDVDPVGTHGEAHDEVDAPTS